MTKEEQEAIEANSLHYVKLLVGVIVLGIVGVYFRFVADFEYKSLVADIIFIIAIFLMLKVVFAWLK